MMLYIMIGVPGSGKSYVAHEMAESLNAVIHSSDDIREELFGDANVQSGNNEVFALMHKRVKEDLIAGKNVIYDATNTRLKGRMNLFKMFGGDSKITAIRVKASLKTCLNRNAQRNRVVPPDVIRRFYFQFEPPVMNEGWSEIIEVNNE